MADHRPTCPVLVVQHGPDGPPGLLGDWLAARALSARMVRADRDPLPRDPTGYAAIVLLGSPHGAPEPAWVGEELALVAAAVAADVPVLGICWGAQALTRALGGEVRSGTEARRGWHRIRTADPAIAAGPWPHHHRDVALAPPGARATAFGPLGPAAFRRGRHLGVQFHPEATAAMVERWIAEDPPPGRPPSGGGGRQASVARPTLGERPLGEGAVAPGPADHVPGNVPGADQARDRALGFFDAWWADATSAR